MADLFRQVSITPAVQPGPLAPLAQEASDLLKGAKQTVTVFESTTAGLVQAALQSCAGASAYTTCGAVTYSSKKSVAVLGFDPSVVPRPADGAAYKESKKVWTQGMARRMREQVGTTWCVSEAGACGPTFNYPDIAAGFTAIFVSGPVERGVFVDSSTNGREENMWAFAKAALDLLAECVREAAGLAPPPDPAADAMYEAREDRYGGVEVDVLARAAGQPPCRFDAQLREGLESWGGAGKKGIWLKIPLACAAFAGPAAARGFEFHHAKPEYVLMTRWLPSSPSPLPRYGFTQIGVGGVVVNSRDEVLMVQERVSPLPAFQGSWKLPGGLADPGEDFVETMQREVREETGVTGRLVGVVSIRHSHQIRFGQGDLYVLVKLRADTEEIAMDPEELMGAEWMSRERMESLVVASGEPLDGKISSNNWKMINNALTGNLIEGSELPNSIPNKKSSMLYTAQAGGP